MSGGERGGGGVAGRIMKGGSEIPSSDLVPINPTGRGTIPEINSL